MATFVSSAANGFDGREIEGGFFQSRPPSTTHDHHASTLTTIDCRKLSDFLSESETGRRHHTLIITCPSGGGLFVSPTAPFCPSATTGADLMNKHVAHVTDARDQEPPRNPTGQPARLLYEELRTQRSLERGPTRRHSVRSREFNALCEAKEPYRTGNWVRVQILRFRD